MNFSVCHSASHPVGHSVKLLVCSYLVALMSILNGPPAQAGPIIVGGGAGSGEFYLFYTLRIFPALLAACSSSPVCPGDANRVITELQKLKPYEQTTLKLEADAELGSLLYRRSRAGILEVNKDRLFIEKDGHLEAWSSREAIAFFLSIWSLDSAESLEGLSSRLGDLSELRRERTASPELDLKNFSLTKLSSPVSTIVIEDESPSSRAVSVEIPFDAKLSCMDSTGEDKKMEAININSARWGVANRHQLSGSILLQVFGTLTYDCRSAGNVTWFKSRFRIEIRANKTLNLYVIDPDDINIQQMEIVETPAWP